MTEKRYTVGKELRVVDDNILKGTFYVCIDRAEALKLADELNEFHNENVRLNKENEQLNLNIDEYKRVAKSVKEENEQLKKNPKCRENFDLNLCCEANNRLVKENEQLKELVDYADDLIQSNLRKDQIQKWNKLKGDVE